jgi:hypothetical protein
MTVSDFIHSVPMMSDLTPKQIEFINNYIPSHLTRLNWTMDTELSQTNIPVVINIVKKINFDSDKEISIYPRNNKLTQIKTLKLQFTTSEQFNVFDSIAESISSEVNSLVSKNNKTLINNLIINMENNILNEILYVTVYWRIGNE